ncbi:HflX-like GTP-binding protein [Teredinibacter purpureus]|jgi:GTPases|uniref:HflX-like GTP-binding protein n=1 Tax=Teredinibacter purpureus TaxID=2731756 RepID=UPI0005F826A3|nr:hypothetical protein [Teredinibacter purpureus]
MHAETINGKQCIIVGLFSAKRKDIDSEISSMKSTLIKHGAIVVGVLIQRRGVSRSSKKGGVRQMDSPLNSATVIGPGKVEELSRLVTELQANTVVFYNDLHSTQKTRLQEIVGCNVFCINE